MQNLNVVKITSIFLVIALAIGFVSVKLVSGNRQNNTETEIWSNIAYFNQLEGTWKQLNIVSLPVGELFDSELEGYTLSFNALDNTLTVSRKYTETYLGGDNENWNLWKEMWENYDQEFAYSVVETGEYNIRFNELTHSITSVTNNHIQKLTDEEITEIMNSFKINQNRTKLKETVDGIDIILQNISM